MKTIEKETYIEFEERKSKFIGYIKPISTKDEAENFIKMIKSKHSNATHNCSAYKVTENGQEFFKVDDDGEPQGTAGKPMGDIITYMSVNNLVVVATRYFGGIKLGAGGLIRAYARTAKEAINFAGIIEYQKLELYIIEFSYDYISTINTLFANNKIECIEQGFLDRVVYKAKLTENVVKDLSNMKEVELIKL